MTKLATTPRTKYRLHRHGFKIIGIALWIAIIGGYLYYLQINQLTAHQALEQLVALLETPWGPILYMLLYALSPLVFFSAALLAITGGCIFGAGSIGNLLLALLYTTIGSLGAAQMAYWMGNIWGADLLPQRAGIVTRYAERMRNHSFMTVLIMHLIFLPYELVNYLAGILRIQRLPFLLATFLGSLPGLLTFVPFGASLDMKKMMAGEGPDFSWKTFIFAVAVLLFSLGISYYLRRHGRTGLTI